MTLNFVRWRETFTPNLCLDYYTKLHPTMKIMMFIPKSVFGMAQNWIRWRESNSRALWNVESLFCYLHSQIYSDQER